MNADVTQSIAQVHDLARDLLTVMVFLVVSTKVFIWWATRRRNAR